MDRISTTEAGSGNPLFGIVSMWSKLPENADELKVTLGSDALTAGLANPSASAEPSNRRSRNDSAPTSFCVIVDKFCLTTRVGQALKHGRSGMAYVRRRICQFASATGVECGNSHV